jgi:hypothetical protein
MNMKSPRRPSGRSGYSILEVAFCTMAIALLMTGGTGAILTFWPRMARAERLNYGFIRAERIRHEIDSAVRAARTIALVTTTVSVVRENPSPAQGDGVIVSLPGSVEEWRLLFRPRSATSEFVMGDVVILGPGEQETILCEGARVRRVPGNDGYFFVNENGLLRYSWEAPIPGKDGEATDWVAYEGLAVPCLL